MSLTSIRTRIGSASTIGAVTGDMLTYTPKDSAAISFIVNGLTKRASNNTSIAWRLLGCINKTAGTVTVQGNPTILEVAGPIALSGITATLIASTGNVILRVTGIASLTLTHSAQITILTDFN